MNRRIVSRLAAVACPLLAAAFALLLVNPVGAHVPSFNPLSLWADLAPGGDHRIAYDPCDPWLVIPSEWSQGVENWDTAMGSLMDFDLGYCNSDAEVHMRWENPDHQCPNPDWWGCWDALDWGDGVLFEALILFDYDHYMDDAEPDGRIALSAHEWGHIMSLDEHSGDMCDNPHRIMAYVDVGNQSCQTGPSTDEWQTVRDFYGLLGPVDWDGDGFVDAVELYVGTDRHDRCPDNPSDDAWPLDINKDRYITVTGDARNYSGRLGATPGSPNWWQRLDLNADGAITVPGDVMKYAGKLGWMCYN